MIESYQFGLIVIDGEKYSSDVIIYSDHVNANWWRKESHRVEPEDIAEIIKAKPEILIIGTGEPGLMKVTPAAAKYIRAKGIRLIIEKTRWAWRTYNDLSKSAQVVGAFHLTC